MLICRRTAQDQEGAIVDVEGISSLLVGIIVEVLVGLLYREEVSIIMIHIYDMVLRILYVRQETNKYTYCI
jgi:hypothetical protein